MVRLTRGVATVAAVVAVAASAAVLFAADRPAPEPAPTATASAVTATTAASTGMTATAAATPAPTLTQGGAALEHGYVFLGGDAEERTITVRRERDWSIAFEVRGLAPAVSPDGRRLAYWRVTLGLGATDLRVVDVADPRSDRSVLALSGQTLGGGVVWSSDGQGLLTETHSRQTGPGECLTDSQLLMVDLTSAPARTTSAGSGGCVILPLAWDRPGRAAAGVVTGPGGYATEYVMWNGNAGGPTSRAPIPPYDRSGGWNSTAVLADSVRASADGKLVVATESSLTVFRVWPLLDLANAVRIERGARAGFALWGGGAGRDLIYAIGPRIEIAGYQSDRVATLYTGGAIVHPIAVRPDGSAVLVQDIVSPGGGPPQATPERYRLRSVDTASKRVTEVATVTGGVFAVPRAVVLR